MQTGIGNQFGQQRGGGKHFRLRKAKAVRVFQRTVDREQQQVQGNVVEHDGGEDFVAVELRLQYPGQQGPERTRDNTRQ